MNYTPEDIVLLDSPRLREAVAENLGRDPLKVALDKNIPHAQLVASQVKYLQKARTKLPSYYAAQCIVPGRAFEQSSAEAVAAARDYAGDTCIDLTCGLGVDSLCLSRRFRRVVALERDPALAAIARINFRLLGADNIVVVNASAEEFLEDGKMFAQYAGTEVAEHVTGCVADLIYADPDRRDGAGRRVASLAQSSPNVEAMLPLLCRVARKVAVKLSPLFDVAEAHRIFGPEASVEVVSLGGECKEVLVETGEGIVAPSIRATAIGKGSVCYPWSEAAAYRDAAPQEGEFEWLLVPDVALAKARLAVRYFRERGMFIESDNSFAFASSPASPVSQSGEVMGRVYRIEEIVRFSGGGLKKFLRERGIRRANMLIRDFPLTARQIASQSGLSEGGNVDIAFTRLRGELVAVLLAGVSPGNA